MVEQIFDITPRGLEIPRRVKICAFYYIEIKELEPIFWNPGSRDIRHSAPPGGENQFFSQNFADMYTCLGSPITPKMLTQILEAMFVLLNVK